MYGKSNMETYVIICKIDSQREFFCMAQETQTGAGLGWGGSFKKGGDIYIYIYLCI